MNSIPKHFGLFVLGCLAISQVMQAVNPPPGGGYPNFNTAEGTNALKNLTTGAGNTAAGFYSLLSTTTGSGNTSIGAGTLVANTGNQNTATGVAALLSNISGEANTANGALALLSNTFGGGNTALGFAALYNNTIGVGNTATGYKALFSNTEGLTNTANGTDALYSNTTGTGNTAVGSQALYYANDSANTAVGVQALQYLSTGSYNTALGAGAGANITTADNVICIGNVGGANVDRTCFIGNVYGVTTQAAAVPVYIDEHGQLGTASSSRRYKTDIRPLAQESESILALKPVSFHYKVRKDAVPQFGLIAEEVAEVNPDLVIYDSDGKPYTVRYDAVNTLLLNEFLKEHKKVERLEATMAQQQEHLGCRLAEEEEQIKRLTSGLQKVSAELEITRVNCQITASH